MGRRSTRLATLGLTLFAIAALARAQEPREGEDAPTAAPAATDRAALDAYRSGDRALADALWREAFAATTSPRERARLAYNLGNTAYRRSEPLEAVGWYTLSLRLAPRDGDAWANLELVRAEAELEPADRGDLASTTGRVLGALTPAESSWVLLAAILGWGVLLAGEALRGGPWRRAAWIGLGVVALAAAPRVAHALRPAHPLLLLDDASARSEPDRSAKTLTRLGAGQEVRRLDAVPGWVGIDAGDGRKVWVRENAVFDLVDGR